MLNIYFSIFYNSFLVFRYISSYIILEINVYLIGDMQKILFSFQLKNLNILRRFSKWLLTTNIQFKEVKLQHILENFGEKQINHFSTIIWHTF